MNLKVKVISSVPYIFQVLYVLCFTRSRYQVSIYRTIGPLVMNIENKFLQRKIKSYLYQQKKTNTFFAPINTQTVTVLKDCSHLLQHWAVIGGIVDFVCS